MISQNRTVIRRKSETDTPRLAWEGLNSDLLGPSPRSHPEIDRLPERGRSSASSSSIEIYSNSYCYSMSLRSGTRHSS